MGGLFAGLSFPKLGESIVDFSDNECWKTSLRKLLRGRIITKETKIRISFAYLFRIKLDGKYFLVKNNRGSGKYQPVGGAYKMHQEEATFLREKFSAEDDNKIPVDQSSKLDYRLWIKSKYLKKFVTRFDKSNQRELVSDLSREFKEELSLGQQYGTLKYKCCGRHMTEVKYGQHFQCYELLLADVVEVVLDTRQEEILRQLVSENPDRYNLVTTEQVRSVGVDTATGNLQETIADHTEKILIETQDNLIRIRESGTSYGIDL